MIFHLLHRDEWLKAKANGIYAPASLANEGFIHCSTHAQVAATANLLFERANDLMILQIDESRLSERLVYESAADAADSRAAEKFPHLYGPLNVDAVVDAFEYRADGTGRFAAPPLRRR